jgi:hypothetical protein
VDAIAEMSEVEADPTLRRIRTRARWPVPEYSLRLVGDECILGAGELSLDARVLAQIDCDPGMSTEGHPLALSVRKEDLRTALHQLLKADAIEDGGAGRAHAWHPHRTDVVTNGTEACAGTDLPELLTGKKMRREQWPDQSRSDTGTDNTDESVPRDGEDWTSVLDSTAGGAP